MFRSQKRFTVPRFAAKEDSRRRAVPVYCASNEESEMVRINYSFYHACVHVQIEFFICGEHNSPSIPHTVKHLPAASKLGR